METAVIINLTNDSFLSGKTLLYFHLPNHCKKISKSTDGKELNPLAAFEVLRWLFVSILG